MNTLTTVNEGGRQPAHRGTGLTASSPACYTLPVVAASQRSLARAWLLLALTALVGSGLFSVLLVLARTPVINAWLPAGDFFRVALVVHVDLSVLVWFMAIAGMLWSLNARPPRTRAGAALNRLPLLLCGAGALGMALSAFVDPGQAVMANYIPMLDSASFRAAVGLFGLGALLLLRAGFALGRSTALHAKRFTATHAAGFGIKRREAHAQTEEKRKKTNKYAIHFVLLLYLDNKTIDV